MRELQVVKKILWGSGPPDSSVRNTAVAEAHERACKSANISAIMAFGRGKDREQREAPFSGAETASRGKRDARQTLASDAGGPTEKTGMPLAVISLRCEVVAAFTNPTLHRIISQRFFLPAPVSREETYSHRKSRAISEGFIRLSEGPLPYGTAG